MSAWGTNAPAPTAWGTQVEEEEAKGGVLGPPAPVFGGAEAFPTLGEVGKVSKKDKRKKVVSLAEFQSGTSTARGSAFVPSAAKHTAPSYEVDLKSLPTGPRERSAEEADRSGGLGGAFTRGGYGRGRDDDEEFPARPPREDEGPSKADMSDDWGKDRKFVPGGLSDRGSGFSGRGFEPSRADEGGTWGRSRVASRDDQDERDSRPSSRGFEDRGDYPGPSKADTEERWGANRSFVPSAAPPPRSDVSGDRWGSRRSSSPPPPAGPSASRPRLALKPRTLPLPDLPPAKSAASSESGASAAAEPESFLVPASAPVKKSNPFGAARPREEVLKEQGRDTVQAADRKGVTDRPESAEDLQSRIAELRARIDSGKSASTAGADHKQSTEPTDPQTEENQAQNGVSASAPPSATAETAIEGDGTTAGPDKLSADEEELRHLESELSRVLKLNDSKQVSGRAERW